MALGIILCVLGWWMVQAPEAQNQGTPAKTEQTGQTDEVTLSATMHQFHLEDLEMECTECHRRPENPGPGQELVFADRPDQTSCEDCHDEVNEPETPEGPVCLICHADAETSVDAFPSGENTLTQFSHVTHVDPKGRHNSQGVSLDCALCHVADATQSVPPPAGHAECSVCHADEGTAKPIIAAEGGSEACAECHLMSKIDAVLAKRVPEAAAALRQADDQTMVDALMKAAGWQTAKGVPYRDIVPKRHAFRLCNLPQCRFAAPSVRTTRCGADHAAMCLVS